MVHREPGARTVSVIPGKLTIHGGFELEGVPPGFFYGFTGLRATLRFPDGRVVSSGFDIPMMLPIQGYSPPEKELKVLNDPNMDSWPGFRPPIFPLLSGDALTFQNYKGTPGTYIGKVSLDVYQRLTATLPLKPGTRLEGDAGETTLLRIVPNQGTFLTALSDSKRDGFVVTLRESGVRPWLRPLLTGPSYILQNPTRKEALLGRSYPKDIFGRLFGSVGSSR
jgi:hypothetical protein